MKAYVATSGSIFGLMVLADVLRVLAEGTHLLVDPWWVGMTIAAGSLCVWAGRVLLRLR